MKEKSESEVADLCPTLRDPMDCSLPGSSIHGIFQAIELEWGAIAFSVYAAYCMPITYLNITGKRIPSPDKDVEQIKSHTFC